MDLNCILLDTIPGHVAHALYRLREVSPPVPHGHVAHHAQHDQRRHLLRHVPGPRHQPHTEPRLFPPTVPGEGKSPQGKLASRFSMEEFVSFFIKAFVKFCDLLLN